MQKKRNFIFVFLNVTCNQDNQVKHYSCFFDLMPQYFSITQTVEARFACQSNSYTLWNCISSDRYFYFQCIGFNNGLSFWLLLPFGKLSEGGREIRRAMIVAIDVLCYPSVQFENNGMRVAHKLFFCPLIILFRM